MHQPNRFTLPLIVFASGCAGLLVGCQEPGYRNEVSTNAQGAVEVHRVAKDPFPVSPDSSALAARPSPAVEQRLTALEAQVLELKAEVSRLNSVGNQPATHP